MIPEFGSFALCLVVAISAAQILIPSIGIIKNNNDLIISARLLSISQLFFVSLAIVILGHSFVVNDFSVVYVAQNSNSTLPLIYKITAIWGGHEGSILLWLALLILWMNSITNNNNLDRKFKACALSIMASITLGISLFVLLTSNPFARILPNVPIDGMDLNPLLQDPGLIIHPPMLYMGYVGFSVPFALSLAYLLLPKSQPNFIEVLKPYVLTAFSFLTFGIVLGSWWAYYELGWGGWWMWDPVENASFIPWLMAVALLHTNIVSKHKPNFISWTIFLSICCFALSLLGTFLVRSGVITSVHAFAVTPDRGVFILAFSTLIIGMALAIYTVRLPKILQEHTLKISRREILLLLNIMGFFVLALSVLLGTIYPILTDAIWQNKISVGAPYFNKTFVPIFFLILCLFAPSFVLKKSNLFKVILVSLAFALASILFDAKSAMILVVSLFVVSSIIISLGFYLYKNYKLKSISLLKSISMVLAHLGIAVLILGAVVVSLYSIEQDTVLAVGDSYRIKNYDFKFANIETIEGSNYFSNKAKFNITDTKTHKSITAFPEKRFFYVRELPMTETAIIPGLMHDLYIALCEPMLQDKWSVRIYYKPGIRWVWLGGILIALGTIIGALYSRRVK